MLVGIIYKVTNKVNSKIYIGQTSSLRQRKTSHLCISNSNKNIVSYFHKAIRKYGWDSFEWEIIYSSFSREDMNEKEIYFINLFKSHCVSGNGYNMTKGGDFINPLHIPEVKERWYKSLCESMKRFTGDANVMKRTDVKERHQNAVIAQAQTPDWIESHKVGCEPNKSTYEITFPDGHIEIITGLNQFCKTHKLQQSKMSSVATGDRPHHKGYKCKKTKQGNKTIGKNNINKTYKFITPDKSLIEINNLKEYCKTNNLSYECMLYVSHHKQPSHRGYTIG